jgi:hypothetical protein
MDAACSGGYLARRLSCNCSACGVMVLRRALRSAFHRAHVGANAGVLSESGSGTSVRTPCALAFPTSARTSGWICWSFASDPRFWLTRGSFAFTPPPPKPPSSGAECAPCAQPVRTVCAPGRAAFARAACAHRRSAASSRTSDQWGAAMPMTRSIPARVGAVQVRSCFTPPLPAQPAPARPRSRSRSSPCGAWRGRTVQSRPPARWSSP